MRTDAFDRPRFVPTALHARPPLDRFRPDPASPMSIATGCHSPYSATPASTHASTHAGTVDAGCHALFAQSPVAVRVVDTTGRTTAVNAAFERLFGPTAAALAPNVFDDRVPGAGDTRALVRRALAGEVTRTGPVQDATAIADGAGHFPWIEVTAYPVRDAGGAVREVVLLSEDVTARVAAVSRADALLAATGALVGAATPQEVARVVVEHAAAAIGARRGAVAFLTDGPDGPRTVLELAAATGYSDDALAAYARIPLAAAFPLSDVARTGEPVLLSTAQERRDAYPHLGQLADENGTGAMAAVPLVAPGVAGCAPQVVGALGFNFDDARTFAPDDRAVLLAFAHQCAQAVERAQLYAAERDARAEAESARARAEEANQGKSQFLANMSHELRTPLNAIAGYVQLLDMGLHGPVTDGQRHALARVDRAQHHLLGLINDVLNYAKLESGRMEYDVQPVRLADVLGAVSALVEPQVAAKRLAFSIPVADGTHAVVWADRDKLIQVLVNLLSNAVKFTPEAGSIHVAILTRMVVARGTRTGVAFVRVSDTGVGIPRDRQEGVFDPFVQVRTGYTRAHEGTGLGLAIARDLARGMGGDLRVRSREGSGSTFTVTLRLAS